MAKKQKKKKKPSQSIMRKKPIELKPIGLVLCCPSTAVPNFLNFNCSFKLMSGWEVLTVGDAIVL